MKKILVVDDNPSILEIFTILLEEKGYNVTALQNGEKVIDLAKEMLPDLILLDIMLSGTNGIEICKNLKSLPETKDIPVVMVSAHSNPASVYHYCPADAFIEKPFNNADFTTVIRSQLYKKAK